MCCHHCHPSSLACCINLRVNDLCVIRLLSHAEFMQILAEHIVKQNDSVLLNANQILRVRPSHGEECTRIPLKANTLITTMIHEIFSSIYVNCGDVLTRRSENVNHWLCSAFCSNFLRIFRHSYRSSIRSRKNIHFLQIYVVGKLQLIKFNFSEKKNRNSRTHSYFSDAQPTHLYVFP